MAPPTVVRRRRKLGLRKSKPAEAKLGGEDASTAQLEAIVFGNSLQLPTSNDVEESVDDADSQDSDDHQGGTSLPFTSQVTAMPKRKLRKKRKRGGSGKTKVDGADLDEADAPEGVSSAAWNDPDDAKLEVDLTLRSNKMYAVQGDSGSLLVCDVASKQPIRTMRMSVPGVAAVFSAEKDVLWSADQDCNIYEWDLATGRCKQRIKAAWATGIETLALRRVTANSPTPQLAVGTNSGNIDLYDLSKPHLSSEPSGSIGNLTTMVTSLKFHPEGELLLGASKFKKDSLRLMHCATSSVFQNWPTQKTPLNRITSVDFSRHGGMMALANERGKVLLYQLRQYAKNS